MPKIQNKQVVPENMLRGGGTTLVGLTIAKALDAVLEEARGVYKQGIDPLTIEIKTEYLEIMGPSLGITASAHTDGVTR